VFVATVRVALLWKDWQKALRNDFERQRFYNSVLGEPFAAGGAGLSAAEVLACRRDYALPSRGAGCTMGVDVGEWMHVRISDHPAPGVRRAVFVGRVRRIDELDALLERYGVRCCVVDAQPEAHLVRTWQQSHERGRIWRCAYTDNDLRECTKDRRGGIVKVARTPSLDDATEDIRTERNWLPRNAATLDGGEYVRQMTAPVRVLVEDSRGNPRHVWTKGGADHHRHADNYDKIATQLSKPAAATKILLGRPRIFRAA